MIILIQGAPGSGKSYEATVYHALRAIKRGRMVITNLPLNKSEFGKLDPEFSDLIDLRDDAHPDEPIFSLPHHYETTWTGTDPDSGKDMGPLYIIDECHRALGPDVVNKDVADFFAMHRHKGCDIVMITQNHTDVARTITNRVDHVIHVENQKRKGLTNVYMRRVYSDCGFRPRLEGEMIRTFNKSHFPLYNSYTQGGSGLELGSADAMIWYKQPKFIALGLILVCAGSYAVYGTFGLAKNGFFPGQALLEEKPAAVVEPAPMPAPEPRAVQAAPRPSPDSLITELGALENIRYAGVLSSPEGNMFLFRKAEGGMLTYSATELKRAGFTVTAVAACRITIHRHDTNQIISC